MSTDQPAPSLNLEPEQRGRRFQSFASAASALDVAENVLLQEELGELLADPPLRFNEQDFKYPHNSVGSDRLREAIASLLTESWGLEDQYRLQGGQVLCTPGASAALFLHARARLRPDDSVLIPSPYWQMFDRVYAEQSQVRIERLPISAHAESMLDLSVLQKSHEALLAAGRRPALLLLTNPHNPLGFSEPRQSLEAVFDWVLEETEMEIISDEIYAHSLSEPDATFTSALALDAALRHGDRVHAIWGLAKDFGLSGWMVGVLISRSVALTKLIVRQYARFSPFDSLKSRIVERLLCDAPAGYEPRTLLPRMTARLCAARARVADALSAAQIPYRDGARGAPFFWLDLRRYLDADLAHAPHPAECVLEGIETPGLDLREGHLQQFLACAAGVVLLRGQVMHAEEPGYFRLCYTAEPTDQVLAAVDRLGKALRDLN